MKTLVLFIFSICVASLPVMKAAAADEAQLISVLQSAASPVEKEDACRQLKLIGTAKSLPALTTLLTDEHLYQAACDVLETMPGTETTDSLRAALKTTSGNSKAAIIHALGERPELESLPDLTRLLSDPDPLLASAAASALGKTGTTEVREALNNALRSASEPVRGAIVDALLQCAVQMLAEGDRGKAHIIFLQLNQPQEKEHVRTAAYAGLIRAEKDGGRGAVMAAIANNNEAEQLAALSLARDLKDPATTEWLTKLFPQSSPAMQAALIALLQHRDDPAAAPAVVAAAGSTNSYVRCTALAALGTLGDVTVIPLLADAATSNDETEQTAARQALIELHRGNVADAMVAQLVSRNDKVQVELIRAMTARAESSAAPQLLEIARSNTGSARRAALRAMEHFADGRHIPALVQLMRSAKDDAARAEVRSVFEALADRTSEGRKLDVTPIVGGFAGAEVETRIALLEVSALFADAGLRGAFRAAVRDPEARVRNAATRALCHTRDAELTPDLLELARSAGELNLRALALEGYVRLACDNERSSVPLQKRVALLKPALAIATRPEDKRLILAGLAGVPHPEALVLAEQACADVTVQAEAEIACLQIAKALVASESSLAEAALTRLAANAGNQGVRTNAQAMVKQFSSGWLCAGPYRQDGKSGRDLFDVAFAPEQTGVGPAEWRWISGVADLSGVTAGDNCVVYLKTRVFMPVAQPVVFEIGSDDGIKLWVNYEVTHTNNTDRGVVPGEDKVKTSLRKGWNDLLAKITQNGGGCGLSLRITASDGSEIPGLRLDPRGETRPPGSAGFRKAQLPDQAHAESSDADDLGGGEKWDLVAGGSRNAGADLKIKHEL